MIFIPSTFNGYDGFELKSLNLCAYNSKSEKKDLCLFMMIVSFKLAYSFYTSFCKLKI